MPRTQRPRSSWASTCTVKNRSPTRSTKHEFSPQRPHGTNSQPRWAMRTLQRGDSARGRADPSWCDRANPRGPLVDQPSDLAPGHRPARGPSAGSSSLHWDLWLGPAPERPDHPAYHPFKWRGWWDFGTGALGDMGCHIIDTAFWALELREPRSIEAESPPISPHPETAPAWSIVRYDFEVRGNRPPVKLVWYDGGKVPPLELFDGHVPAKDSSGSLFVGEKGRLLVQRQGRRSYWLLPEREFIGYAEPKPTLVRSPGHHAEWIEACKTGKPTGTSFVLLSASTSVPRPVLVSTPPSPNPAARIRSASVPWGTSSTSRSPAIICRCVSGFAPICEAIRRFTIRPVISLPMAIPGNAVSLAITVRSFRPAETRPTIKRRGVPTPKNPPIMRVAPSGIMAMAFSSVIALFIDVSD